MDNDNNDNNDNSFFNDDLALDFRTVEVGKSYPIYAMITKIIKESDNEIVVELNNNITANLLVTSEDKIKLIKERAFEPGIFVSTIIQNDPDIIVDCQTVIFGKKLNPEIQ